MTRVRIGRTTLDDDTDRGLLANVTAAARAYYLTRRRELAPMPPPRERSTMTEAAWQKQVVAVATTLGWWSYHPALSKWSARGWPDLSLLRERTGDALFVELKRDDTDLTADQVTVIDRMLACGLRVAVFRPHDGLELVAQVLR